MDGEKRKRSSPRHVAASYKTAQTIETKYEQKEELRSSKYWYEKQRDVNFIPWVLLVGILQLRMIAGWEEEQTLDVENEE